MGDLVRVRLRLRVRGRVRVRVGVRVGVRVRVRVRWAVVALLARHARRGIRRAAPVLAGGAPGAL